VLRLAFDLQLFQLTRGGFVKRLAYILYVTCVLLIAGLARAHADVMAELVGSSKQVDAYIQNISPEGSFQLKIATLVPNSGYGHPVIELVRSSDQPNVLILKAVTSMPQDNKVFAQPLIPFTDVVNVVNLVEQAQLKLDLKQIYLIKTDSYPFAITVFGSDLVTR
jgi:hypothetical protein